MGKYLNKGNDGFRSARNSEFVDKSQLIEIVNATLNSERQYTCVSRARRFGKSIGAEMLYAYYDQWCAEEELFADLKAYSSPSFQRHFRRYPVLYLDMTDFITSYYKDDDIVAKMQRDVVKELKQFFPDAPYADEGSLADALQAIASLPGQEKFIMIVDEWDVFTVLIHLGYLSYDRDSGTCRIPNREIAIEFKNAVVLETGWEVVLKK